MDNRIKAALCIAGAVLCIGCAGLLVHVFSGSWVDEAPTTAAGPALSLMTEEQKAAILGERKLPAEPESQHEEFAYISGAVENPGVYAIKQNYRIFQLVEDAGGLRWDADAEAVNMAAPVSDGEHVHIKTLTSADGGNTVSSVGANVRSADTAQKTASQVVNVNSASAEELCLLPGIGPVTAEKIVEYRTLHGAFVKPDDLMNVSGIGEKKLEALRSRVSF